MKVDHRPYVIADGRLVGAWDVMYRDCDDPWEQSTDARSAGRRAVVRYANELGAHSLVELGCGLGYFTAELEREGFDVVGVDVSPVAIERATELHPGLADRLVVGRVEDDLARYAGVDAVVFAEITWYALDHLDSILEDLVRYHGGKHLIHLLSFYAPGRQRYGREFFTTPEELAARFGFPLVAAMTTEPNELGDYAATQVFKIPG